MLLQILAIPALLLIGFAIGWFAGYRQAKRGLPEVSSRPSL